MSRPRAILGARVLDPASDTDLPGGLLIAEGRILDFGPHVRAEVLSEEFERIDATGLCLAPGLVDMRVRLGEPGAEHKERIDSAVAAAAAGGITSLAALPDCSPPLDEPAMVEFVARRARKLKSVKVHPYGTLTRGLEGRQLAELGLLREAGAVAFTDGSRAVADARVMRRGLAYASRFEALVVQHAEEPSLAAGGCMNEGEVATRLGLAGIPACAEVMLIERDLRLVELTGARYHAAHLSSAAAVAVMRRAKEQGLPVSCDVSPHHLLLTEQEVEGYRTYAKVSPPLRTEEDRQALRRGLLEGVIDAVASDHTPQDQDSKRLPFAQAAFGTVGLETLLAALLELHHEGGADLLRLLAAVTVEPARRLGLDAGRLRKGAAADLVLFDAEERWTVTEQGLRSLSKNTIFEGREFRGRVCCTMVDGRTVFERPKGAT